MDISEGEGGADTFQLPPNTQEEQDSVDEELRKAAYHGELDKAKMLVETCGANLRAKDYQGGTPLHYAAIEGHVDMSAYLVEKGGADLVHVKDKVGGTPLPVACFWGRVACAKYLVSQGADVEAKDVKGMSARDKVQEGMGLGGRNKVQQMARAEIVAWLDELVKSRRAQRARMRWRVAGRGVAALLALHERAAARVNAPGGAGYEEARSRFEAAQQ